nr:MAG TPA: hypothetical protein [Caudoviricetes sp.]
MPRPFSYALKSADVCAFDAFRIRRAREFNIIAHG